MRFPLYCIQEPSTCWAVANCKECERESNQTLARGPFAFDYTLRVVWGPQPPRCLLGSSETDLFCLTRCGFSEVLRGEDTLNVSRSDRLRLTILARVSRGGSCRVHRCTTQASGAPRQSGENDLNPAANTPGWLGISTKVMSLPVFSDDTRACSNSPLAGAHPTVALMNILINRML